MTPDSNLDKIEKQNERTPERGPLRRREGPTKPSTSKIADLFKGRRVSGFESGTGFQGGPTRRTGYRLALWSWLASMIDGLILISLSTVFILTFSFLMQANVESLIGSLIHSQHRALIFTEVFILCSWIYMITVRTILGSTIGEWACEIRLGQPQERLRANYVLRVAWRSTLIVVTGVVTLPLVSLIVGEDTAGAISGLRLFSLK
jgi:hypothetical protein